MKKRVYLAGAIDHAEDGGKTWRRQITPMINDVGIDVFDPCIEADGYAARLLGWSEFSHQRWAELKKTDFQTWQEISEEMVDFDLKALINSDGLLVLYDDVTHETSQGTPGEITVAKLIQIPMGIVFGGKQSVETCVVWVTGCLRIATLYDSMDDFIKVMHLLGRKKQPFFPKQFDKVYIDGAGI